MLTAHHGSRVAAVTLAAAALAVVGMPSATPSTPPNAAATRAISVLLADPDTRSDAAVPPGFEARFGYRPQVRDGLLGTPDGECSSPVPLPHEFTPACRQHDYGYDLIRYADARGEPLPGSVRRTIDARLADNMRAACTPRTPGPSRAACTSSAVVADRAVRLNSWRQNDGIPGSETPRSLMAAGGLCVAGAGTVFMAVLGLRRKEGST